VPGIEKADPDNETSWDTPSLFGPVGEPGSSTLFELAESSLCPIVFLDEPQNLREAAAKHLAAATENYERHGRANSPAASHYFCSEEELAKALEKTSQIHIEQLGMGIASTPHHALSSRPSPRYHGDVVACMTHVKSQLASGGRVFLTAASTGEIERFADICREYEVPYVLGESEDAAAGFTAEGAQESAGMLLIRAPFPEGVTFPDANLTPIFSMSLPLSSVPAARFAPPVSSAILPNSKPAIMSFMWTTASASSKASARSNPMATAANSCS
jgi:hypothetical protein